MNTCQNCGRKHEGQLIETFMDGDNKPIEIVVCDSPRYETVSLEEFWRYNV